MAPLVGWLSASLLKSVIDSLKTRRWRLNLFSYGGIPSIHASVMCTTTTLIGAREGTNSPSFALAIAITALFMVDSIHLRQWVGQHAQALNQLRGNLADLVPLRERVGHKPIEMLAGMVLGIACGLLLNLVA
jgi:acid phosphatase family membrane protein YuiD